MSIEIMSKIWNVSLSTHSMKLVAIAIADNANDQGHCWPGMKTLARKCDLTENGVRKQIIKLESMGMLKVDIRGGRESNRYQFDLDKLNSLPPNAVTPSPKPRLGHPQTPFTPPPNAVTPNRNVTVIESKPNPKEELSLALPQKQLENPSEDFEQFWKSYPKKTGKFAAEKAWFKIKGVLLVTILTAVKRQKASEQWQKDGGRYIPNPATWLNQGRWMDEVKTAEENKNPNEPEY